MRNSTFLMVALGAIGLFDVSVICAQNPLRSQEPQQRAATQQNSSSMLSQMFDDTFAAQAPSSSAIAGRFDSSSGIRNQEIPQRHFDPNVTPASFNPIPNGDSAEASIESPRQASEGNEGIIDPEETSFIEREKTSKQPDKSNFGQLMSKVGMNLAFVLSLAIGFVLLAKQWMKSKVPATTVPTNSESLHVKEVLVLDSKTTLRLVQWRTNRILVATDSEGIKSVNVLNSSFDQTLDELSRETLAEEVREPVVAERKVRAEPEPNRIDEKLLRQLLQNANAQKVDTASAAYRRAA